MTLRVRKEGNSLYPEKAIIVGPLAEILLVTPTEGTVAEPTDAAATLRYSSTKGWQGFSTDPLTQETKFPGAVRTIIRGQSVRADGNLFSLGPNTQFANISTETDCYTAPVAGLVDGAYATDSPDSGMPPIIRGGMLLPAGQERGQKLRIRASCGINFQAATASATTIASKLTLRAYLINLVTLARVKIVDVSMLRSQCSISALTTFLPCDFDGTFAPASLDSGTVWNIRNHDYALLAHGAYGASFAGFKEQFAYPKIDLSVDQGLIFTQQCDGGFPFGSFFFNQVSISRE